MRELFDAAIVLHGGERERYIANACAEEPTLRAELEELLRCHDAAPAVFDLVEREGDAPAPRRIGPYRILGVLGAGGMGIVYRAQQDRPMRTVALKVLQPGALQSEILKRFAQEAELLGRLQHPGIAHIFEAGSVESDFGAVPYFAMELIEGEPLTQFAETHGLDVRARCALIAQVCDAVQHAHERGVIHRDLKPANVLVVRFGSGAAQVKVLDFGVARAMAVDADVSRVATRTGQLFGTLPYMSPEQIAGSEVDWRCDVYALGVILYELLARRLPLDLEGQPLTRAMRIVASQEPDRLGSIVSALRGDLETIAETALAKGPDRRYSSAADLAADLRRYLANLPIAARPPSAFYQVRKFAQRHRVLVGGVLATMAALLAGLIVVTRFAAEASELAASRERIRVRERENRYRAEMSLAATRLDAGRGVGRVRALIDPWQPAGLEEQDLRGWEWYLLRAASADKARVVPGNGVQYAVQWVDASRILVQEADGAVLREIATGRELARFAGVSDDFIAARLSPDRSEVAVTWHKGLRVYDVATGRVRVTSPAGRVEAILRWVPGVDQIAFVDGSMGHVWDLGRGQLAATLGNDTRSVAFSSDGRRFARVCFRDRIEIGECATWQSRRQIVIPGSGCSLAAFAPDGRLLAIGGSAAVRLWDLAADKETHRVDHGRYTLSLAWSADSRRLAICGREHEVCVWNAVTGETRLLRGHTDYALDVAFSPDGAQLASAGEDGTVRVWTTDVSPAIRAIRTDVQAAADHGQAEATWAGDGTIQVNSLNDTCFVIDADHVQETRRGQVVWTPDGTCCARAAGRSLEVTDGKNRRSRVTLPLEAGAVTASHGAIAMTREARWLAATCRGPAGCSIWLWQPFGSEPARRIFSGFSVDTAWRPDGRVLAIAAGNTVRLYDTQTAEVAFERSFPRVTAIAWHPSGKQLAVGDSLPNIHLWTPGAAAAPVVLRGHTHTVRVLAWHPHGHRLASGGNDRAVKLWDPNAAAEVMTLAHDEAVHALGWRPDGKVLVSASDDGVIKIWDASSELAAR